MRRPLERNTSLSWRCGRRSALCVLMLVVGKRRGTENTDFCVRKADDSRMAHLTCPHLHWRQRLDTLGARVLRMAGHSSKPGTGVLDSCNCKCCCRQPGWSLSVTTACNDTHLLKGYSVCGCPDWMSACHTLKPVSVCRTPDGRPSRSSGQPQDPGRRAADRSRPVVRPGSQQVRAAAAQGTSS